MDKTNLPSSKELEQELKREQYRRRYKSVFKSTLFALITASAVAVLVATLWLPVLQIYGSSMTPTLTDGDIAFCVKDQQLEQGDVIAFYYNNKILVKRVIGVPGDWLDMDESGNIFINYRLLEEPYLTEKSPGQTNIEYPFQVPDGKYFVMGDQRASSVDSRNVEVGCIDPDQIVGKILFRVWPVKNFGLVK